MQKFIKNYTNVDIPVFNSLDFQDTATIKRLPVPTGATDAVNKQYVDLVSSKTFLSTGAADVSVDLQTALNECTDGDILKLPPGVYNLQSGISIPKGVTLLGSTPYRNETNYTRNTTDTKGTVIVSDSLGVNTISMSDYSSVVGIQFLAFQNLSSNTVTVTPACLEIMDARGVSISNCAFNLYSHLFDIEDSLVYISNVHAFAHSNVIEATDSEVYLDSCYFSPLKYFGTEGSNLLLNSSREFCNSTNSRISLVSSCLKDTGDTVCVNSFLNFSNTKLENSGLVLNANNTLVMNNVSATGTDTSFGVVNNDSNTITIGNSVFENYTQYVIFYNVSNTNPVEFSAVVSPVPLTNVSTSSSIQETWVTDTLSIGNLENCSSPVVVYINRSIKTDGVTQRSELQFNLQVDSSFTNLKAGFTIELPQRITNITNEIWCIAEGYTSSGNSIGNCVIFPVIGSTNVRVFYTLPTVTESVFISGKVVYKIE